MGKGKRIANLVAGWCFGTVLVVALIWLLAVIFHTVTGNSTFPDEWTVEAKMIRYSRLTRRKCYKIEIRREGTFSSWIYEGPSTQIREIELPKKVWNDLDEGITRTEKQLRAMQGRSFAGTAWDWLKKPRKE